MIWKAHEEYASTIGTKIAAAIVINHKVKRELLASHTVRLCEGLSELVIRKGNSAIPAVAIVHATISPLGIKAVAKRFARTSAIVRTEPRIASPGTA